MPVRSGQEMPVKADERRPDGLALTGGGLIRLVRLGPHWKPRPHSRRVFVERF